MINNVPTIDRVVRRRTALLRDIDLVVWHTHVTLLFYDTESCVLDIMGERTVETFRAYSDAVWKWGEPFPTAKTGS